MTLEEEFHSVRRIPQELIAQLAWLPFSMVAWIYSLTLTQWNKCVFLNPNLLVIEIIGTFKATKLLSPALSTIFVQVLKNSDEFFRSRTWVEDAACSVRRPDSNAGASPLLLVQQPGAMEYQRIFDIAARSSTDRGRL
jgi:hypothetical protein